MTLAAQAFNNIDPRMNAEVRSLDLDQWKYLVSHIGEPATAQIIVEYLDNDPAARAHVGAIYMRARDTIQRSRPDGARGRRLGEMLGRSVGRIFPSAKRAQSRPVADGRPGACDDQPCERLVWPELRPDMLSA